MQPKWSSFFRDLGPLGSFQGHAIEKGLAGRTSLLPQKSLTGLWRCGFPVANCERRCAHGFGVWWLKDDFFPCISDIQEGNQTIYCQVSAECKPGQAFSPNATWLDFQDLTMPSVCIGCGLIEKGWLPEHVNPFKQCPVEETLGSRHILQKHVGAHSKPPRQCVRMCVVDWVNGLYSVYCWNLHSFSRPISSHSISSTSTQHRI